MLNIIFSSYYQGVIPNLSEQVNANLVAHAEVTDVTAVQNLTTEDLSLNNSTGTSTVTSDDTTLSDPGIFYYKTCFKPNYQLFQVPNLLPVSLGI